MDVEEPLSRESNGLECCVVWTPIPLLSWVCPAIGHVGICDSRGVVRDFQGDRTVGKGQMLFGDPRQKWKLQISPEALDQAIEETTREFGHRHYDIICSNCHFYVASVLDNARIKGPCCFQKWNGGATAKIIMGLIAHARSLSVCDFVVIWIPFIIIVGIILLCVLLAKGAI